MIGSGHATSTSLQAVVVSIGLPFCVVIVVVGANLVVALRREGRPVGDSGHAPGATIA